MSDLWIGAFERVFEDFDAERIDAEGARERFKSLGLDPWEIEEHIDAMLDGAGATP